MSKPLSPPPSMGSAPNRELPAYLSNGVVGLRVRGNPLTAGMALLNGYTGLHPDRKIEAAAIAPYPIAVGLAVNGVWLSDVPHSIRIKAQAYDFSTGELTTHISFTGGDVALAITVLTFCCRHQPTLVVQEVSVLSDGACDLKFQNTVDTTAIPGRLKARMTGLPGTDSREIDGSILWESDGALSYCGIASATVVEGPHRARHDSSGCPDRGPLVTQVSWRARPGRTYRLRQIAALVPSVMHSQPDRHAERLVALAKHQGFETLRRANAAEWEELWKGRIVLHGAGRRWQQLADAAFFYMNASVHASSPASTSMFGLATWHDYHYYYGHVMWDIETFSLPSLTVSQPEAAEALLEYRFRSIDGARRNAQSMGRRGLQFPWESAPTTGQEATPSPGTGAWHEDHISLDVALGFARYAQLTGDDNFLLDRAWPVIAGVANWISSRAHRTRRGYEIRRTMGIAERKQESDNDAFTMLSARAVLQEALRIAARLSRAPGADWEDIARNLVLPLRDALLLPHTGYRSNEEKGATPDPLMAVFPLASELDGNIKDVTLDYFLALAGDYIGSPMLSSLYGVWASRRGDRKLALRLLEDGYARFVTGRFCQTLEYRPDRFPEQPMAGPFFANMGGFLMSLLFGFTGIDVSWRNPKSWAAHDVVLPQGWSAIEVDRLWLNGRPAKLHARHSKRAEIRFL